MSKKWYTENRAAALRDNCGWRKCKKCEMVKIMDETNFHKHPNGRLRFMARCRDCSEDPPSHT